MILHVPSIPFSFKTIYTLLRHLTSKCPNGAQTPQDVLACQPTDRSRTKQKSYTEVASGAELLASATGAGQVCRIILRISSRLTLYTIGHQNSGCQTSDAWV